MKKFIICFTFLLLINIQAFSQIPSTPEIPSVINYCGYSVIFRTSPPALTTWYWQGTNPTGSDMSNSAQNITVNISGSYYLRAHNSSGWSENSAEVIVNIIQNPAVPTNINVFQNCGNTLIQKGAPPANQTYFFEFNENDQFTSGFSDDNDLTIYSSQNIYVKSRYNTMPMCWSDALTLPLTINQKPAMPIATKASNIDGNSFTANWNFVSGATAYFLDVSISSDFSSFVTGYNNLNVGNVNSYSVNGLTNGTEYFYRLRSYNGTCTSDNSNIISSQVFECTPSSEIYIYGLSNIIDDGNTSPDFAQNTKFGNVQLTNSITNQFVIENRGETNLVLTGAPLVSMSGSEASEFSVTSFPAGTIAPGASSTFEVTFTPTFVKPMQVPMYCTIEIPSNDPQVPVYDFMLLGYGVDNNNGPFRLEGDFSGVWSNYAMIHRGLVKAVTFQATSTGTKNFLFNNFNTDYNPKWAANAGNQSRVLNTLIFDGAVYNGASDCQVNITTGKYYTFIVNLNQGGNNNLSVLETSYNPGVISNVNRQPLGFVYPNDIVTISVELDHVPNTGENVFVRWTNNNWVSSSLATVTGFSGNTGTATIPVQAAGTVVDYYALTTFLSNPDVNTVDYYSLAINNNTGNSNYQYVVKPIPVITMFDDGLIYEGSEDGEVISVILNSGIFQNPADILNWDFLNLPAPITIGDVVQGCRANEIFVILDGNSTIDYDNTLSNSQISVNSNEIDGVGYNGAPLTTNNGVEFTSFVETANISSSVCLSHDILNFAIIQISLTDDNFLDNNLSATNFILNNEPEGVTVFDVAYINPLTVNLILNFDGTDFSSDFNISVTIEGSELFGGDDLTTNSLTIYTVVEPEIIDLEICGSGQITMTSTNSSSDDIAFSYDGINNLTVDNSSPYEFLTYLLPEGASVEVFARNVNSSGCSSDWVSAFATANILPSEPLVKDTSICGTGTFNLQAVIGNDGNTVDFSLDGLAVESSDNSNPYEFLTPSISEGNTLIAYARTTNSATGCTSLWENCNIYAKTASVAPSAANADNENFCEGDVANITLTYSGGTIGEGATAEWYDDVNLTNNIGSGNNLFIAAPVSTTTYYVVFEGGCNDVDPVSVTINVNTDSDAPDAANCSDTDFCVGVIDDIILSYSGGNLGVGATSQWYSDSAFTINIGAGNNVIIDAPVSTTTYYVRFEGLCGNTDAVSVPVNVHDFPIINICNDTLIEPGTSANLFVTEDLDFTYLWSPEETLDNNSIYNPIANPSTTTDYVVTVTNQFGCSASQTVNVSVADYEIIINTGVTPNGDGYNDTWVVENIEHFPNNHVEIYNRQGVIVYEKDAYKNEWKGTYLNTNKELPVGTYYFLLDLGDDTPTQKGSVTIIR